MNSVCNIGSDGKVCVYDAGDLGSIPGLGRSLGERKGNPLQYSCLEKSHGVTDSQTLLSTCQQKLSCNQQQKQIPEVGGGPTISK